MRFYKPTGNGSFRYSNPPPVYRIYAFHLSNTMRCQGANGNYWNSPVFDTVPKGCTRCPHPQRNCEIWLYAYGKHCDEYWSPESSKIYQTKNSYFSTMAISTPPPKIKLYQNCLRSYSTLLIFSKSKIYIIYKYKFCNPNPFHHGIPKISHTLSFWCCFTRRDLGTIFPANISFVSVSVNS